MHLPAQSPFIRNVYHEAFELLVETRDYVEYAHMTRGMGESNGDLLEFTQKSSRLTAQLTDVMTWLMAQRAAGEGQLTLDEALSTDFAMAGADEFETSSEEAIGTMPTLLVDLVGRGDSLYNRVDRLEKEIRAKLS